MSYSPQNVGFFDTIQMYFLEATGRGIMFSGRDMELLCRWRDQGASAAMICRGIQEAVSSMAEDEPPRGVRSCQAWIEQEIEHARERSAGGRMAENSASAPADPLLHQALNASPADVSAPDLTLADADSGEYSPDDSDDLDDSLSADQLTQATHQNPRQNPYQELLEGVLQSIEQAGQACQEDRLRRVYREAWRATRELLRADDLADPFSELAHIEDALADGYFRALDRRKQAQIEAAIAEQNRAGLAVMSPEARRRHIAARRRSLLVREHGLTRIIE
jgi:hypothetical protein